MTRRLQSIKLDFVRYLMITICDQAQEIDNIGVPQSPQDGRFSLKVFLMLFAAAVKHFDCHQHPPPPPLVHLQGHLPLHNLLNVFE